MDVVIGDVTKRKISKSALLAGGIIAVGCIFAAVYTTIRHNHQTGQANATQTTLKEDPANESLRLKNADAKSALFNYYLDNKQYDKAGELTVGESPLQQLQSKAIIAEEKGDKQTAIAALKSQIEYYKKLPTTETNYDMEIGNIQTHIRTLEQR